MKINKRIACSLILVIMIFSSGKVFANTAFINVLGELEYTDEFKEWLELSDEEKSNSIIPRSYKISEVTYEYTNPIRIAHTVGSATLSKYDLRDYIPENLVVRNQQQTNTCWAFASLGMLESHLGLQDYINNKTTTTYDFSERHMQYATLREFNDDKINIWGANRGLTEGGNAYRSRPYLTNGLGPVKELDMPFENNENKINIEEIQGKTVVAQVYDTIDFPTLEKGKDNTDLIKQMKDHIKKNGGIEAGIHGADLDSEYYNIETGAIYSNDTEKGLLDHDVVIVGWDDNYAVENFKETCRPQNKGAWIIKNSWGTESVTKFADLKVLIFDTYKDKCIQNGWNTAEEIPDDFIKNAYKDSNYTIRGDELVLEIGDNGFMYVSYEDVNIYQFLYGIEKASTTVNYDKIYQYDELGAPLGLPLTISRVFVSNIFDRTETETEYLSEVSVFLAQATTCKVYVNPNGASLASQDLLQVELQDGKYENLNPGYHTLELKEPLKLTSDKFSVVLELEGKIEGSYIIPMESIVENTPWSTAKLETDKSFWTIDGQFEKNVWASFSETERMSGGEIPNGDSTIKAFTIKELPKGELSSIEIAVPPTKTDYIEGQDFDKTGMVVNAVYQNSSKEEITGYTIENGTNLKVDQKTVIIKYEDKVTTQNIKVTAKTSEDEKIENPESTDFGKAKAIASNIKAYYFTDKTKKEYIKMDVLINEIARKENDSYKYYYYLSSSKSENNIKNWVEIDETQNSSVKLEFNIDTNDISNYTEVSKSDNLYIYIKEVVKKDERQKELVTSAISLSKSGDVEVYKDDKLQQSSGNDSNNNSDTNNNNSNNNNDDSQKDDTTSPSKLPAAGLKLGIVLIMISIAVFGLVKLMQYERMNF